MSDIPLQRSVSKALRDEIRKAGAAKLAAQLARIVVNGPADLEQLEHLIKSRTKLPKDTTQALRDEVKEIRDDVRWTHSARGQSIVSINAWLKPLLRELRASPVFENVFIGGHAERKKTVLITGRVKTAKDLTRLEEFMAAKQPPFPLIWDVHVGRRYVAKTTA